MRRYLVVSAVAIGILTAAPVPASADYVNDGNDVSGRLDIMTASARNDEVNALVQLRINTQWGFGCAFIARDAPNRTYVLIDAGDDGTVDVIGRFVCRSSGKQFLLRMDDGSTFGATHPLPDRLVVNVGWEGLPGDQGDGRGSVVFTTRDASSAPCIAKPCKDRAPDGHRLRAW